MIAEGKKLADAFAMDLRERFAALPKKRVAFVIFGDDPASKQFVSLKMRVARELGVDATLEDHPEHLSEVDAMTVIDRVVAAGYDGIVVQLPLPSGLDADKIIDRVPQMLDIDVLGTAGKSAFISGTSAKIPPVARAIDYLLAHYDISFMDKQILIIGRGKLVGEPVAAFLAHKGIPFSVVDKDTSETDKLRHIAEADLIVSGAGVPSLIQPDMVKDSVILIDAGTSEQAGKIVGDIGPACANKAALYTPVPGGIGPLTVVSLFANLLS